MEILKVNKLYGIGNLCLVRDDFDTFVIGLFSNGISSYKVYDKFYDYDLAEIELDKLGKILVKEKIVDTLRNS